MSKQNFIIYFSLCVVAILQFVYVTVQSEAATKGIELAKFERQITDWKAKNGDLYEQYLEAKSLRVIDARAKQMGFVPAEYIYLK